MKYLIEIDGTLYGYEREDLLGCDITLAEKYNRNVGKLYQQKPGVVITYEPVELKKVRIKNLMAAKEKLECEIAQVNYKIAELRGLRNELFEQLNKPPQRAGLPISSCL